MIETDFLIDLQANPEQWSSFEAAAILPLP